ncbi:MAG: redoxin domain-containing protein [Nitrosopumilus sp.]|nr:redoxin domain-containing protein [Nitrosopumilus sp.]
MSSEIGSIAPNVKTSAWIQGLPTNIDKLHGNIVVIEVFQVNCPGCFLYGIPQAISLYEKYKDKDVKVFGIATAFEDYDKNTPENLKILLSEGKVLGETYKTLRQHGKLVNNDQLYYKIPFPVAMDQVTKMPETISQDKIKDFIEIYFPDYQSFPEKDKEDLFSRVENYLRNKEYSAETFEMYKLKGTPSSIIIDRDGILRYNFFGSEGYLEGAVKELLQNR